MSDWVSYNGKGMAKFMFDQYNNRKVLVGESIKDICTLLGLDDSEKVELESSGEKTIAEFKEKDLADVGVIYTSVNQYIADMNIC